MWGKRLIPPLRSLQWLLLKYFSNSTNLSKEPLLSRRLEKEESFRILCKSKRNLIISSTLFYVIVYLSSNIIYSTITFIHSFFPRVAFSASPVTNFKTTFSKCLTCHSIMENCSESIVVTTYIHILYLYRYKCTITTIQIFNISK